MQQVRARRAFFDAGHYDPVAEALSAAVLRYVQGRDRVSLYTTQIVCAA